MSFDSDQERVGRAEAVRRILAAPGPPPGRFAYSNAGYTLLAAIVARASGEPFERYVRDRLLDPAGMHATGWLTDDLPGRRAHGFVAGSDRGRAGSQAPLSWSILGAGGMLSTAADLARRTTALETGRILSRSTLAEYEQGRLKLGPGAVAYGAVVGRSPRGTRVVTVGGDTDFGYTSDLRRFIDERVAIVVLSATDRHPARTVAPLVERAFLS